MTPGWDEDESDGDDSITVREVERAPKAGDTAGQADALAPNEVTALEADLDDPRPVTLRFVPDSLVVQRIQATDDDAPPRAVRRWRCTHDAFDNPPY